MRVGAGSGLYGEDMTDCSDDDQYAQLQPDDTLMDGELSDVLDRGYSPPDYEVPVKEHESLDERLADEEPDVALDDGTGDDPDFPRQSTAGTVRAGRLIAPDRGDGPDVDAQLLATDAGVDGAGASAEEAAIHIIDEN